MLGVNTDLVEVGIGALREAEQIWVEGVAAPGARPAGAPGTQSMGGALARLAEARPVYLIPFYRGEIGVANRLDA